jgi:hypothetical protein
MGAGAIWVRNHRACTGPVHGPAGAAGLQMLSDVGARSWLNGIVRTAATRRRQNSGQTAVPERRPHGDAITARTAA